MKVNLDALIAREDFEAVRDGDAPVPQTIDIKHLKRDQFFYQALRKPDFQRETTEWDPTRVVGLVQTFIEGDLVPAVIIWKNKELLFLIDGSHRLSALIAWVADDYGDGGMSQQFFNYSIPEDQLAATKKTRESINKLIGSYADHKDALTSPEKYGPDIKARARALGSRALQLQWVRGVSTDDDVDGRRTIDYLTRCRRVMRLLVSKDRSSLGLHPAIYFYSWTRSQQPILFLALAHRMIELDRSHKLNEFISIRKSLEEYVLANRMLLSQVVITSGTINEPTITAQLFSKGRYSYLQPEEQPFEKAPSNRMSAKVRGGLVMRRLLETAPRCIICGGFLPPQAVTIDHTHRREDGGLTNHENTQLAHPYCNTGYKESQHAKLRHSAQLARD